MPYTKEQYLEDKSIVESAPDGADEVFIYNHTVNYIDNHENGHQFKIWDDEDNEWVFSELVDGWEYIRGRRSLQDIRDKIELYETVNRLKTTLIRCKDQFDVMSEGYGADIRAEKLILEIKELTE